MSWPPIFLFGSGVFVILLVMRFLVAFRRGENLSVGAIFGFVYTSFGTMMAISSSVVAGHFAIFGEPYPGESMEDVQLIILIAATLILCGGLYYYLRDMRAHQPGP